MLSFDVDRHERLMIHLESFMRVSNFTLDDRIRHLYLPVYGFIETMLMKKESKTRPLLIGVSAPQVGNNCGEIVY